MIIKLAFLGVHYRKLGKNEAEHYAKKNEHVNAKYFKHPVAKGIKSALIGGAGGILGHSLASLHGASAKTKALATAGGILAGAGLGYGANEVDIAMNNHKIKRLRDKNNKWIVFGKGKSDLDNINK